MDESYQLIDTCRLLAERSLAIHERIQQAYARDAEQAAQLAQLDERCNAALALARQLQRRIPTWPTASD